MLPTTRYARSGEVNIAYQVFGDGARDLVIVPGYVSHVEACWEHPPYERFMRRLASFARVIVYDKRGCGLSDPLDRGSTFEQRMDDTRAVMDAVGSDRAAVLGISEGAAMSGLFAATHPDRVEALILYGGFARATPAPDFDHGMPAEAWQDLIDGILEGWGEGISMWGLAPSGLDDPAFRDWWEHFERLSASPGVAAEALRLDTQIDIREHLVTISAPTLVIHRTGDILPIDGARWMAERIPDSRFVELPGDDHWPWATEPDAVVDEMEEFLTGERHEPEPDRVLATVLFTDIVSSTERATQLGDRRWRDLLTRHDQVVRGQLERYRGREVKSTGDGFLATFDGPARGIRCACAIRDAIRALGIEVRAGLHTGECELRNGDLGGIAVHIGARVASEAGPGEVLVSSTVKELVAGAGIEFVDRGRHVLKGAPGEWRLFAAGA